MTKFTSKISGVDVRFDTGGGRQVLFQEAACSACDAKLPIPCNYVPLPENAVAKKLNRAGWRFDRRGKHKCPTCILEERKAPPLAVLQPKATPPAPPPILAEVAPAPPPVKPQGPGGKREVRPVEIDGTTYATVNDAAKAFGVSPSTICRHADAGTLHEIPKLAAARKQKEAATMTTATLATEPRTMTPDDRRRIFRHLDGVYDATKRRYVDSYTDHTVAQELDVPRKWIEEIREQNFGPVGINDDMIETVAQITALKARLEEEMTKCLDAAASVEKAIQTLDALRAKLDSIMAAVGPQKK